MPEFVQLDDSVQVYVSGFLKAKTPTAARVVYSNVMDSQENDTIEFQSYGIFGVNDCGLSIATNQCSNFKYRTCDCQRNLIRRNGVITE
jgi:hypothetical protein